MGDIENDNLDASAEHSNSLDYKSLYQDVTDLKAQVKSLQDENNELKGNFFSIDKLKNDDSAVCFCNGFPNFDILADVFNYLQPKLEHVTYWRGSDKPVNLDKISGKNKSSSKPGPKLSLLEEFVLVLKRFKVGLFLNDHAERFGMQMAWSFTT